MLSLYLPSFTTFFITFFWLDMSSHWFHMYATVIKGGSNASHKTVACESPRNMGNEKERIIDKLLRVYYHNKFIFVMSVLSAELLWLLLLVRVASPTINKGSSLTLSLSSISSTLSYVSSAVMKSIHAFHSPNTLQLPLAINLKSYVQWIRGLTCAVKNYYYYHSWLFIIDSTLLIFLPFWIFKQASNVCQLIRACSICNVHDKETNEGS